MSQPPDHLLNEALRLPEAERSVLAARLIDSLDTATDDQVETAWGEEIRQRLEEIDAGTVRPIPWPEVRRLLLEDADDDAEP